MRRRTAASLSLAAAAAALVVPNVASAQPAHAQLRTGDAAAADCAPQAGGDYDVHGDTLTGRGNVADNVNVEAYKVTKTGIAACASASALTYGGEFDLWVGPGKYLLTFTDENSDRGLADFHTTVRVGDDVELGDVTLSFPAPTSVSKPTVSGDVRIGGTLVAAPGTWALDGHRAGTSDLEFDYQWLRDGVPVRGAMRGRYIVTAADVRHAISVRVTAAGDGTLTKAVTSEAVKVKAVATTTTLNVLDRILSVTKSPQVTVSVAAAGQVVDSGRVTVLVDGHVAGCRVLTRSAHGQVSLTLPQLKAGVHSVTASYDGDGALADSDAAAVRLLVVKTRGR